MWRWSQGVDARVKPAHDDLDLNPQEFVMAGLDPAIHVFCAADVDTRVKPAHDGQ